MIDQLCKELVHHLKAEISYPPVAGQHIWDWFWELDRGRQAGMQANALSWGDIGEWQRMTGTELDAWELNAIRQMEIYRIDPEYDPTPVKQEPKSLIASLKELKKSHEKKPKKK